MRLNTANRSFFTLVGLAAVPYVLIGSAGCGVVLMAAYRVAAGGWHEVSPALVPALVVTVVVAVGTARAAWAWRDQAAATGRLAQRVESLVEPIPPRLTQAAGRTRLAGRVDLVRATESFSFAYGLNRPRVAVSTGLLESATDPELDAVLTHERYHVSNRDPLKVVVARVLSAGLFFLPALQGLRSRYSAASELAADRRALRSCDRAALAGAMYRAVRGPDWDEMATAAAIGGPELLDVRVTQLETGREPALASLPTSSIVSTGVVLGLTLAAFILTLLAMGPEAMGSMNGDDMGAGMSSGIAGLLLWPVAGLAIWLAWRRRTRQPS